MRVLVVYESVLGNTRAVAEAVADGVRTVVPAAQVQCLPAGRARPEPPDADLVIVGAPTHFFGLPAERTRRLWVDGVLRRDREGGTITRLEPGAAGPGLREWFDEWSAPPAPVAPAAVSSPDAAVRAPGSHPAAAFDTRFHRPLAGSAARRIAHQLRRHGFRLIVRPEGFLVEHIDGPLRSGERERARAWGVQVALAAGLDGCPELRVSPPER